MARTNRSRFAVLGALSVGPRTGYEIQRDLAESVGHFWTESYGQIYPILRELLESGEVTVSEDPESGRGRKVYRITPAGTKAFQAWLRDAPSPLAVRNELLLKLFFGGTAPPEVAIGHLERALAESEAALQTLEGVMATLERDDRDDPMFPYWAITVKAGIAGYRAHRDWCQESLSTLTSLRARPVARRARAARSSRGAARKR